MDETFKPNFTGIPGSIPANVTLDTFKDLKAPIVLKNSPAIQIIEKELADRREKLKALQDSNTFPNRQKQHEARIQQLEDALANAEETAFSEYVRDVLRADGVKFLTDETDVSE